MKNDLCIMVGFCDLLVAECPAGDPRRADLLEIHRAARHAMGTIGQLTAGTR